jgi:hypothetical protein
MTSVPLFNKKTLVYFPQSRLVKTCNAKYHYFKDRETEKVLFKIPTNFVVYRTNGYFVCDGRIDLNKTNLHPLVRESFYSVLLKIRRLVDNDLICFDYPLIIRYLAMCEVYKFPLMKKKVRCKKDNEIIEVSI